MCSSDLVGSTAPTAHGAPGGKPLQPYDVWLPSLYDAWVVWPRLAAPEAGDRAASDLPVDPADAKIDFLGARDLAPQPGRPVQVRSVLDADLLTWIAARALAPGEPATPRPYVARELHLFLTTSNLQIGRAHV